MKELTIRISVDDLMEELEPILRRIVGEEIELALKTIASQPATITNSPDKDLLNTKEAAAYLGVSTVTLYRLRKEGKIGYFRVANRVLFSHADHIKPFLASSGSRQPKAR